MAHTYCPQSRSTAQSTDRERKKKWEKKINILKWRIITCKRWLFVDCVLLFENYMFHLSNEKIFENIDRIGDHVRCVWSEFELQRNKIGIASDSSNWMQSSDELHGFTSWTKLLFNLLEQREKENLMNGRCSPNTHTHCNLIHLKVSHLAAVYTVRVHSLPVTIFLTKNKKTSRNKRRAGRWFVEWVHCEWKFWVCGV